MCLGSSGMCLQDVEVNKQAEAFPDTFLFFIHIIIIIVICNWMIFEDIKTGFGCLLDLNKNETVKK